MRKLSNLKALQAFETAARHQSYVGAAEELHVTPAAVGQLVRSLEEWLDKPLFQRRSAGSQRLVLTPHAALAIAELREGLDKLDSGLRRLRGAPADRQLMISVSQAFAAKWLMPRLERFTNAHPDIEIRLDVSDRLVDMLHGDADVAIRCGDGTWPDVQAVKLLSEEVFPVCSPQYLQARELLHTPQDLLRAVLIHDLATQAYSVFPTWKRWLEKANVKLDDMHAGLGINSSGMVIQAAINAQGIALARSVLVADDLQSGKLVRLFPEIEFPISWGYFLVFSPEHGDAKKIAAFQDWILTEAVM